jgi:hypothetical protein
MEATIRALELDVAKHTASFRDRWSAAETRLIPRGRADISSACTSTGGCSATGCW